MPTFIKSHARNLLNKVSSAKVKQFSQFSQNCIWNIGWSLLLLQEKINGSGCEDDTKLRQAWIFGWRKFVLVLAANAIKQNELRQYILGKTNTNLKIASNKHLFRSSYCTHSYIWLAEQLANCQLWLFYRRLNTFVDPMLCRFNQTATLAI